MSQVWLTTVATERSGCWWPARALPAKRRPALDPLVELVDGLTVQGHPEECHQLGCLLVGEGEVGHPELHEAVAEAVAVEREHGVDAPDEDEAEVPQRVPEQEVHLVRQIERHHLVAVQHEREATGCVGDQRRERGQPLDAENTVTADGPEQILGKVEVQTTQALQDAGPEPGVCILERHPSSLLGVAGAPAYPFGDQGRLARSGRAAHENERHRLRP